MKRRELIKSAAAFGCMATIPFSTVGDFALSSGRASEPMAVNNPTTTHHSAYRELAAAFPDITVKRGARFVDQGNIASAGGLSSGIDLALHVVERYFGRDVAQSVAYNMEYQGQGWLNADSNEIYAKA